MSTGFAQGLPPEARPTRSVESIRVYPLWAGRVGRCHPDVPSHISWAMGASVFWLFALVVLIIATLGILGIASYSVETRMKELGIRKVLGASFIGVPAGLFCGSLLQEEMGPHLSLINTGPGFGSAALVDLLTVPSQTIRAGQIEPVKVLKAE